MPRVSVIVPTYNRADWLADTVRSALSQTHPPLEVIVVDDGSTDDTEAVARGLGGGGPVRYVRQVNGGVGAARNAGARLATGDLLAFLDCEDLWEPTKLAAQIAALSRCAAAGWSITDCTVVDAKGLPVAGEQGFQRVFPPFGATGLGPHAFFSQDLRREEVALDGPPVAVYAGDAFRLLFLGNFVLPSSAVVRRELFERSGGFDPSLRLAEETEYFHRLAATEPVAVVMSSLVRYRVGLAGTLTAPANTATLIRNALNSLDRARVLREPLSGPEQAAYRAGRRSLLERLAFTHLSNYNPAEARAALNDLRQVGNHQPGRLWLLQALTLLPPAGLRALHRLKRRRKR